MVSAFFMPQNGLGMHNVDKKPVIRRWFQLFLNLFSILKAKITAIGTAVPDRIIDNHYFETFLETTDEWIRSRSGITTRRFAADDEFTSDLCLRAAHDLAGQYQKDLADVDFVIVATITPDLTMPTVAAILQDRLGLKNAGAIDISAACAGFSYGITLANGLIAAGTHRKILVFGSETLSRITDFTDRSSCVLFGDGAGAVLVEADDTGNILAAITGSEGSGGKDLYLTNQPRAIQGLEAVADGKIHQNGRAVFKWAVSTVAQVMQDLSKKAGIPLDQIDWFVPHSANLRIIEALCQTANFPIEKTLESITLFGNTSSASIPLAFARGISEGKVRRGDTVMLIGFGGGLVYSGIVFKW